MYFKRIHNFIGPRRARTISLHAMNNSDLALRFLSCDRSKFLIQLKYPKSERFNINYITYIDKLHKHFDN